MDEMRAVHGVPGWDAVVRLLERASLPTSDLTHGHMSHFFYTGSAAEPSGIVGVELLGNDALLRSLVVSPDLRGSGLGSKLVTHAEHHARMSSATSIYLLTTTAKHFFLGRGYLETSRDAAPPAIRSTSEFSGLCPASSAFLLKRL
jgi:amino-acid N-acetyltransferase